MYDDGNRYQTIVLSNRSEPRLGTDNGCLKASFQEISLKFSEGRTLYFTDRETGYLCEVCCSKL